MPDELSEADKLRATLIAAEHRFPGGYQVAIDLRLGQCIADVERLFAEHSLPGREQLISELTLWHCHAQNGIKLMEHSYQAMQVAACAVEDLVQRRRV